MLSEAEIRDALKQRMWAMLPTIACAVVAVLAYFIAVGNCRETLIAFAVDRFGELAREITPIVLVLPAFPVFLVPTICAESYAQRFKTVCPACDTNVSPKCAQLLATRRCPSCGERIVEGGRAHFAAVYKRYMKVHSLWFLKYWFWAWPSLGILSITWWLFDHSAFQQCPQCLWLPALIGTSAAGWASLRTHHLRYVPQLLASVVMLGIGTTIYWYVS